MSVNVFIATIFSCLGGLFGLPMTGAILLAAILHHSVRIWVSVRGLIFLSWWSFVAGLRGGLFFFWYRVRLPLSRGGFLSGKTGRSGQLFGCDEDYIADRAIVWPWLRLLECVTFSDLSAATAIFSALLRVVDRHLTAYRDSGRVKPWVKQVVKQKWNRK